MRTLSADVWLALAPSRKSYGSLKVRAATRKPRLLPDEIAMKVRIEVPQSLFTQPVLSARITARGDAPNVEVGPEVIAQIEEQIHASTGLRVELVQQTEPDSGGVNARQ